METRCTVPPDLVPFVEGIEGFEIFLPRGSVHFGEPSTALTVLLAFDPPFDVGWAATPGSEMYPTLVAGLHTAPSFVRTHGRQFGVQLGLTPLGCRALFSRPCAELTRELVRPDDLGDIGLANVQSQLAEKRDWPGRFATLIAFLRRRSGDFRGRLGQGNGVAGDSVVAGWNALARCGGRRPIGEIAMEIGVSRKTMLNGFRAEFGLAPKEIAMVMQFRRAKELSAQGLPLNAVAGAAGYSDQAHMAREWLRHSGRPPAQAIGNPFPIIQDLDGGGGAQSMS